MVAKVSTGNDVGGHDDAGSESHGSVSGETLMLDGQSAREIEPRPSRQMGLKAFFARGSVQGRGGANPAAGAAAAGAVDGAVDGRTGVAWGKSFAPPSHMYRARVDSLESMLSWPAQFNAALHEAVPGGILSFLKEQLEDCTYSTCFSGVDAPGSVSVLA